MGILGGKPCSGSGGFLKVSPPGEEHRDRAGSVPEVCRASKHASVIFFLTFCFLTTKREMARLSKENGGNPKGEGSLEGRAAAHRDLD